MTKLPNIAHDELLNLLSYDDKSGVFTWKVRRNSFMGKVRIGAEAGHKNVNGYIDIRLNGKRYQAHRLAWFYVHQEWAKSEIDHINGVRSDNSINNLRCVTSSQNGFNAKIRSDNRSGCKGVSWGKSVNKWVARIGVEGKYKHLGCFNDINDAIAARRAAEEIYHGEYARSE